MHLKYCLPKLFDQKTQGVLLKIYFPGPHPRLTEFISTVREPKFFNKQSQMAIKFRRV